MTTTQQSTAPPPHTSAPPAGRRCAASKPLHRHCSAGQCRLLAAGVAAVGLTVPRLQRTSEAMAAAMAATSVGDSSETQQRATQRPLPKSPAPLRGPMLTQDSGVGNMVKAQTASRSLGTRDYDTDVVPPASRRPGTSDMPCRQCPHSGMPLLEPALERSSATTTIHRVAAAIARRW